MSAYKDPVIWKYLNMITEAMPEVFKGVYQGDPIRVPYAMLPALVISKDGTDAGVMTNAEDGHEIRMILTVITDVRSDVSDDRAVAPGIASLYDILEGRGADYKLKDHCVLNVLRHNAVVDAANNLRTDLSTITKAEYGMTVGKRDEEAFGIEGQVRFTANFIQVR
jgi:hypothetical protein